jgi:deoxycytidylate deaminase
MTIPALYKKLYSSLVESILEEDKLYYVGAMCLNSKNKILSLGFNSYVKTHPRQKKYSVKTGSSEKCFLHAEIASLIRAKGKVKTVLVLRLTQNKVIRISKPCKICSLALAEAGVEQVYYTDREGRVVSYLVNELSL